MNSQKLSSLILGVFTMAVASSLLFASATNHQQTNASVQSEMADVHSQNVLLADGSRPVPPPPQVQLQNVLLADGSRPVPPPPPVQLQNVLLADGSRPVPPPPPVQPNPALNVRAA